MLQKAFDLVIRELCETVLSEPNPRNLPSRIIEHVQDTFPVEWSTLWVTEQKGADNEKRLRLAAASKKAERLMRAEQGDAAVYDFGEGLTGLIAEKRATVNITKPEDFARYRHVCKYDRVMYDRDQAGELCRCVLGVPLLLKSTAIDHQQNDDPWRVIGVLKLENVVPNASHRETHFTQRDLEIIEGYGAVIAVALEKAQMRADSIRIGAGLLEVSSRLLEELGDSPNLEDIVRQTAIAISAEACSLWLRSGLELRLKAAYGYRGDTKDVPPYHLEISSPTDDRPSSHDDYQRFKNVGLTVYVANSTTELNLRTAEEVRRHFAWKGANDQRMWKKPHGEACYSLVAIPLIDKETKDLKGVFKIENKQRTIFQLESSFSEDDQQLLRTLGNSISLSLIIAERIDRLKRLEQLVGDIRVLLDLEEALFFILTGLTHSGGLQYNRAAVFLKDDDESCNRLICRYAVGQVEPGEWQSAINRERESGELRMDELLQEFRRDKQRFFENAMMNRWRRCIVDLSDQTTQILARHSTTPNQETANYNSWELGEDDILRGFAPSDFVIIPIYFDKELLGVIYADNQFTGNRINRFECGVLDLFAGMAGAVIQASRVPSRLARERDMAWRNFSRPAAHRLGTEAGIIDGEAVLIIKRELRNAPIRSDERCLVRRNVIGNSLRVIRQAVNRLRLAVRDYQRLSCEPECPVEFDLIKLIEWTVKNTVADFKGIDVNIRTNVSRLSIRSRRNGLAYVFEELLINAWKEVANDVVNEEVETLKVLVDIEHHGDEVSIMVSDSGAGIPESLHDGLFKHPSSARRGGTGLGLAIVGQILSENGGCIELIRDGKPAGFSGACMKVTLPLVLPS